MYNNVAIIGSSGAIGNALLHRLADHRQNADIHAFSRRIATKPHARVSYHQIDYTDESRIAEAASIASANAPLDLVLVTTGLLHDRDVTPEKSLRDLSSAKFRRLFEANTILPALLAKHFLPKIVTDKRAIFAAVSARVGSISDNRLGGWYAYRASKAALNMVIKNAAIEIGRRYRQAVIVGLHPGTVDSSLSKPFQGNVPEGKLFTPAFSAEKLLLVLDGLEAKDSGKCFAWDGSEVEA